MYVTEKKQNHDKLRYTQIGMYISVYEITIVVKYSNVEARYSP